MYRKKTRLMNGKRLFKRGQAPFCSGQSTLELTVAMIAVFILLLASVKLFVWVNERLVLRQEDYEATRVAAASNNPGVQVDESGYPLLDIFGESAQ